MQHVADPSDAAWVRVTGDGVTAPHRSSICLFPHGLLATSLASPQLLCALLQA